VTDLYRVLRPRGVIVHIIDLRDHFHMKGDHDMTGDWLEALRYPQKLYDAMFSNRSTNINRLRAGEWLDVFADAGFETEYEERKVFRLPDDFDRSGCRSGGRGSPAVSSTSGTSPSVPVSPERGPAASAVIRAVNLEHP
jgi:hypothetical protein